MPSPDNPSSEANRPIPTVAEIDTIAALTQPVLRNLLITQCYCDLSAVLAARTGPAANWCSFATWASKQAGQTIRREDLRDTLHELVLEKPGIRASLGLIAALLQKLGARQTLQELWKLTLGHIIAAVTDRASDAVSRGNKKVFEEIAREFARFIAACYADTAYNQQHIEDFCAQLKPGPPPEGQAYLALAFTRYYAALFEDDPQRRAELQLLANLEIGFHEQTRLQPEIAESLNAAITIDPQQIRERLLADIFPGNGWWGRLRLLFQRLFGKVSLLDKAIDMLVQQAQQHVRKLLTAHLLTLTIPPHHRLQLGHDLTAIYPALLQTLINPDLLALLAKIDPTPDSLLESGATDWANLPERMHFIAELFRCYHSTHDIFDAAFTTEQLTALRLGKIPEGQL
ncbi:MAG: hypothetical protein INR73_09255 [Williamsia sp.]|nr:hypothetical protein [Williamsia sp.]